MVGTAIVAEEALYELEAQILELEGISTIHLYIDRNGYIVLGMLEIRREYRKQGIGTKIIDMLCEYADEYGMTMALTPADRNREMGTTGRERLFRFYGRFGFVRNKGRNKDYRTMNSMLRKPHV